MSLPGKVAIPSFQSRAPIMSNSAPWEGPSLGGVSVIPTPLISPNLQWHNSHINNIGIYWHKGVANESKYNTDIKERGSAHSSDSSDAIFPLCWHCETITVYQPLCGFTYEVPSTPNAIYTCTCKQSCATSPVDGDCVLACRIHHALRFQTKQSIIILFCWSTNQEIGAQTAPLGWTCIQTIDKHDEICLNFKFTTQVHLFLVLTVSLKNGCLPGYVQLWG